MKGRNGIRLRNLLRALEDARPLGRGNPVVTGVTSDSRRVEPGALFVAVRGAKADGHFYVREAVAKGAVAVVCETPPSPLPNCAVARVADARRALSALSAEVQGHPSRRLQITGVTGTNGKTSTTAVLREVLATAGRTTGSIGTLGYWMDGHWLESDLTTPEPAALHGALRRMADAGVTHVCMEVSSDSLVQHRVADVAFEAAVLTNITPEHLNTHGTLENYTRAKRRLFEQLEPGAVAILPAGFEQLAEFRAATRAEVLTYGTRRPCDIHGTIVSLGLDEMHLVVRTPLEEYPVRASLVGSYNCLNILAAAAAAFASEVDGETVTEALHGFQGVPGRLERVAAPGRDDLPTVCVDYAHTPDALQNLLATLRPLVRGQLVCVVGCGGDRDKAKRPAMAKIATALADMTIFTADNSRSEYTENIIADMLAGVSPVQPRCRLETDRRRAIRLAVKMAGSPDSLVVVCGKGCERYLEIGASKIPFDDRAVARQVLEAAPVRRRRVA
jgi:UDP-N-acetylmuramoyl-L-alanyl-D-glutamate--2,6-diaminopimelate ligase